MREMGNLDDALWIANPEYRAGGVSLFIRAFSVEEKPVRATLTITGLGWFASYLNGERTDDEYFNPCCPTTESARLKTCGSTGRKAGSNGCIITLST